MKRVNRLSVLKIIGDKVLPGSTISPAWPVDSGLDYDGFIRWGVRNGFIEKAGSKYVFTRKGWRA